MKHANHSGSVDQVGDRFRFRAMVEGKRQRIGPLHPTREQAEAARDAYALERESFDSVSEVTLRTLGAAWLAHRAKHGSNSHEVVRTLDTERSCWELHVAPSDLAQKAVALITPKDVIAFTHHLRGSFASRAVLAGESYTRTTTDRKLSRSSQRHALRLVRGCLTYAIVEQIITTNPAATIKILPGGPRPRDLSDDWLREREIAALLACDAVALDDRAAYAVAIGTALRKDDLRLLEVNRVEPDEGIGAGIRVWISKTQRWHRAPVLPWLWPILDAHIAALPQGARYLFSPDADRLTPYAKGHSFRWPSKPAAKGYERSALEKAAVARKVRFHDLRGTTATHLALGTWGRRWALHEIQGMLAHSDQKVTERYVRHAETLLAAAAQATPGGPVGHGWPRRSGVSATPPGGIEPPTVRLEDLRTEKEVRGVTSAFGQRVANAARDLEESIARGVVEPGVRAAVLELAREHPLVAAYVALAEDPDGEHAVRRAADLLAAIGVTSAARAAGGA